VCHLATELKHKVFLLIKFLNFDLIAAGERLLQLNELREIRSNAYESSKTYKGRMKSWLDHHINQREFWEGDLVILFNSRLKLFPGKLRSRWLGPFKVMNVYPYEAIDVGMEAIGTFKANGSRLKHYLVGEPIEGKVSYDLPDASSS